MKRIIASLLCISLIFTQYKQAEAAVPVVVAGVAVGAALLLAAGAVQYYSNPAASSAIATATGNMYSNVTAYTSGISALGQGYMLAQSAALGVSASNMMAALSNSASGAYSSLKDKLYKPPSPVPAPASATLPAGTLITTPYGSYVTTAPSGEVTMMYDQWGYSGYSGPDPWARMMIIGAKEGTNRAISFVSVRPATPDDTTPRPVPLADVPKALTGANDGGSLAPSDVTDLNDLIKNNPSIATPVSVESTATGDSVTADDKNKTLPPYVPPATVPGTSTPLVPSDTTTPTTTTGLGTGTTTAAEQAVAIVVQQVKAAENAIAADPANPTLQADLAAAQAALAAAQAALNQAKAAENEVYINPAFPNRKTLNFDSWLQLVNVLPTKFPFNLVTALGSYLEPFLAPAVPPSFELHIYQDKKLDIDLAVFDTPVAIFRWGLALLLTFGLVQFLIRWWKGTA